LASKIQTADQLLNLLADQAVETDDIAERFEGQWSAEVFDLINNPEGRDLALWTIAYAELLEPLGVVTLEEFLTATNYEYATQPTSPVRNLVWQAMVATARQQANMSVVRDVLKSAERQADDVSDKVAGIDQGTLQEAAQEGIGNARFEAAKGRRNGQS
jgi:hypothetical protein